MRKKDWGWHLDCLTVKACMLLWRQSNTEIVKTLKYWDRWTLECRDRWTLSQRPEIVQHLRIDFVRSRLEIVRRRLFDTGRGLLDRQGPEINFRGFVAHFLFLPYKNQKFLQDLSMHNYLCFLFQTRKDLHLTDKYDAKSIFTTAIETAIAFQNERSPSATRIMFSFRIHFFTAS